MRKLITLKFSLFLFLLVVVFAAEAGAEPLAEGKLRFSLEPPLFLALSYQARSHEEFRDILARAFRERQEEVGIDLLYDFYDLREEVERVFDELACLVPYDYWHYERASWTSWGGSYVEFQITYRTSLAQERELEENLRPIISAWRNLSPKEKVRAVHDWVVENTEYDTSYSRHTAYEAFFEHRAVCQGYSLLTYKMLSLLGVEGALVTGQGNGGDHMWNLVRLCCGSRCAWFHLDTTWDDPLPGGMLRYDYFLLSDAEIRRDHVIESACGHRAPEPLSSWEAACTSPGPAFSVDVKVNGLDGGLSLSEGDMVRISLSLSGEVSGRGDYFLWARIPGGECYCFLYPVGWRACECARPLVSYEGMLVTFTGFVATEVPSLGLPRGDYEVHFAVDASPDGVLSPDAREDTLSFTLR